MSDSAAAPLADAEARLRIVSDLDANLAVEAAAGSGKTTCLVGRLLTLAKRGGIGPGGLVAAVTFTRKAAAELRDRLQAGIERELAAARPDEAENLAAAAKALRRCHIGTIHSFCGRLLRERPVEAGVDPEFLELDDEADLDLRERAWDEFSSRLLAGGAPDLVAAFEELDLAPEDLREGFGRYAEYPDVGEWPGWDHPLRLEGTERLFADLLEFAGTVEPYAADPDAEAGSDKLLPCYRLLRSWAWRQGGEASLASLHSLLPLLPADPNTTQQCWRHFFGDEVKTRLGEEENRYRRFHGETVAPFLADLRAARYAAALRCYREAAAIHARLRRDARGLNFRDLLLKAAALLRDYPEVRRDLSERYARLLVDEVQDTDPIQAEILFLLAGDDPAERDWRRCRPRPGALFVVGDPKQSIYRFTRADIATYSLIKKLLAAHGGEALHLSVNFRSQPDVIDWVNRAFAPRAEGGPGRFPAEESDISPAYVPLRPGRTQAGNACFTGVYLLETLNVVRRNPKRPDVEPRGKPEIIADEAERIAAFIRHALDAPLFFPDKQGEPRPATPDDFLVMTRKKDGVGVIADALVRAGVPARISGSGVFPPEGPARLLVLTLEAALTPDDPILQVACLRSRLFGVSDADLYAWRRAGGGFNRFDPLPERGPETVRRTLAVLADCGRLFRDHAPVAALKAMADRLGLWPLSCLEEDGGAAAGSLLTLIDMLDGDPRAGATPQGLLKRLRRLLDHGEFDAIPALGESGPAVRVMNLHKTKGLEAPAVFLAGWPDTRPRPVQVAVDRSGEVVEGRLGIYRDHRLVACPPGWDEAAAREREFLDAEELRLSYVAATRAGSALVVSAVPQSKGLKSAMIAEPAIDRELPEEYPPRPQPSPREAPPAPESHAAFAHRHGEAVSLALEPSYAVERAKHKKDAMAHVRPVAEMLADPEEGDDGRFGLSAGSDAAMALGEVLHAILESALEPGRAEVERLARTLLAERDLPTDLAAGVADMAAGVWASELWRRANSARRTFRELPFVMPGITTDGKPSVVRGVIDLAFEEEDGWVVADYKSDRPRGQSAKEMAERHRGQLEVYADALRQVVPDGAIKEMGVYFLRTGKYVTIHDSECGMPNSAF